MIVCKPIEKNFLDFPPALIIEILSPSTASKDRLYKFNLYQHQKIPYYFIIDVDKESIEIYELKDEVYRLAIEGKEIKQIFNFEPDCKPAVDFTALWK